MPEDLKTEAVKPAAVRKSNRVTCYGCGVVVDLAGIHPSPHKSCPVCKSPLDADAVECTAHNSQNAADKRDTLKATLKGQALADVHGVNPGSSVTEA